jgi:hypothetical protein
MNEATLIEKLIKIEALFAGVATEGERVSADRARQRILQRLSELIPEDPPVEYKESKTLNPKVEPRQVKDRTSYLVLLNYLSLARIVKVHA